jgi:hypothetical protein
MNTINWIKQHFLPILFLVFGLIDQNSDLLITFATQCNINPKHVSLLRMILISIGGIILYLKNPKKTETNA